jgi:hypothetical protein
MRTSGSGLAGFSRERALRVLEAAMLLDAGLLVWVAATGGFVADLGPAELSVTSARGPSSILLLGLIAHLAASGTLRALLVGARERLRSASNLRRAAMALSLVLAWLSLRSYARVPGILGETPLRYSGISINTANHHVPDLVYQVVSRPAGEPPVVHIEDVDPRGHFASYYCYPRALRMEPARRRWSLVSRVLLFWETEYDDPGFAPEPLPPPEQASAEYALAHGAPLLVAPALLGGYDSLWSLAQPPPEPLGFFEAEAHAGLLDVEPRAFASWSDVDRDGFPDLVLEDPHGRNRSVHHNRDGLRFEPPADARLAAADADRTLPQGIAPDGTPADAQVFAGAALGAGRAGELARALALSGFGDLDGDGDLDVLAIEPDGTCRLLLDRGDGELVDATSGSGLELLGGATACALGDIEGDGRLDLFVARAEGGVLLRNLGHAFEDVTAASGLPSLPGRAWARFADFDNDGLDDLYIAMAPLGGVRARDDLLFLNAGGGTFTQLPTGSRAVGGSRGGVSMPAVCDHDRDGDLDLLLAGGLDPMFQGGPTLLASRGCARPSVRVELWGEGDRPGDAAALRAVTSERFVLSRALSQMAGGDGSERGAHLGLGHSAFLRYVQVVRLDGSLVAVQGVPAASVLAFRGDARESALISSHPAALLGEVPTFDLADSREKLRALWGVRPLPAPDEDEIGRRSEAVLAHAQARRTASGVRVRPFAGAKLFQEGRRLSVLPERVFVEHITVDDSPRAENGTAQDEASIAVRRRWTSRGALEALLPAASKDVFSSGARSGSSAGDAALGRYGQLTAPRSAGSGLVGFVSFRAPAGGAHDVTHLVRPWQSEAGGVVPADWFEAELLRAARDRATRAALGALGGTSSADATWLGAVPCSTAALAQAARAGGLERDAAVLRAVERVREEVALDALARALIASHEPDESELQEQIQSQRPLLERAGRPVAAQLERELARSTLRRRFALSLLDRVLVWSAR